MLRELTLATIQEVDNGLADASFQLELDRVLDDCEDRPLVSAARSIVMRCKVTPVIDPATRSLDDVKVSFSFDSTTPKKETREYSMAVRKRHGRNTAVFNDGSPGDVDQMTLDEQPHINQEETDDDSTSP